MAINRYVPIEDLRKVTKDALKRKEEEDNKLRQAHMMDLYASMRDCVNEYMAVAAAKGHYAATVNMETALSTPCNTDEEHEMRLKVLGDIAAELHGRSFNVRFNNKLHITISWEE